MPDHCFVRYQPPDFQNKIITVFRGACISFNIMQEPVLDFSVLGFADIGLCIHSCRFNRNEAIFTFIDITARYARVTESAEEKPFHLSLSGRQRKNNTPTAEQKITAAMVF